MLWAPGAITHSFFVQFPSEMRTHLMHGRKRELVTKEILHYELLRRQPAEGCTQYGVFKKGS